AVVAALVVSSGEWRRTGGGGLLPPRAAQKTPTGNLPRAAPAVIILQPPRHVCAYQLRHRGALAFVESAQRLSVVVIQPDHLIGPERLAQTVLPLPVSFAHGARRHSPPGANQGSVLPTHLPEEQLGRAAAIFERHRASNRK